MKNSNIYYKHREYYKYNTSDCNKLEAQLILYLYKHTNKFQMTSYVSNDLVLNYLSNEINTSTNNFLKKCEKKHIILIIDKDEKILRCQVEFPVLEEIDFRTLIKLIIK